MTKPAIFLFLRNRHFLTRKGFSIRLPPLGVLWWRQRNEKYPCLLLLPSLPFDTLQQSLFTLLVKQFSRHQGGLNDTCQFR
jgi:hypothetical protein